MLAREQAVLASKRSQQTDTYRIEMRKRQLQVRLSKLQLSPVPTKEHKYMLSVDCYDPSNPGRQVMEVITMFFKSKLHRGRFFNALSEVYLMGDFTESTVDEFGCRVMEDKV